MPLKRLTFLLFTLLAAGLLGCGNEAGKPVADLPPMVDSPAFEEGFVSGSDDVELYYRKVGDAPQVVLMPSRLFIWDDLSWLGEHFTFISYEMRNRGHSFSVEDSSLLTLEREVEDLEAVRRHFKHAFEGSAMNHHMSPEQIAEVTVPVLTIHGTQDRNAAYGAGREWAMHLPNARLITIEGAGHHVWSDDPTVNDDILTFLQGEWPGRAEIVTGLLPE